MNIEKLFLQASPDIEYEGAKQLQNNPIVFGVKIKDLKQVNILDPNTFSKGDKDNHETNRQTKTIL